MISQPGERSWSPHEWAEPEATRLEELRLVAVEYRAEALLALGRNAGSEIEQHVRAHPLRENAVRLLALAYYRAGRQADALATLRRAREILTDELGVDPGPGLRALEADILAHSESLHREEPVIPQLSTMIGTPGQASEAAGRTPGQADEGAGRAAELTTRRVTTPSTWRAWAATI